ncbi:hypothetical protein BGZ94_002655 [Podila epigama]|nr:hypothetical protein BGZ94_002655 [Podila epigama]
MEQASLFFAICKAQFTDSVSRKMRVAAESAFSRGWNDDTEPPTEGGKAMSKRIEDVTRALNDCVPMSSCSPSLSGIVIGQTSLYRVPRDGGTDVVVTTPFFDPEALSVDVNGLFPSVRLHGIGHDGVAVLGVQQDTPCQQLCAGVLELGLKCPVLIQYLTTSAIQFYKGSDDQCRRIWRNGHEIFKSWYETRTLGHEQVCSPRFYAPSHIIQSQVRPSLQLDPASMPRSKTMS